MTEHKEEQPALSEAHAAELAFAILGRRSATSEQVKLAWEALRQAEQRGREEEREQIQAALRQPFLSVYLDGRNEHGSHVLPLAANSIGDGDILKEMEEALDDQAIGYAERVIDEAERLNYKIGDAVVTTWKRTGPHVEDYWELASVDALLSALFFGAPSEQAAARAAISALRTPSTYMLEFVGPMDGYDIDLGSTDRDHIDWWQAMIDAALNEEGPIAEERE